MPQRHCQRAFHTSPCCSIIYSVYQCWVCWHEFAFCLCIFFRFSAMAFYAEMRCVFRPRFICSNLNAMGYFKKIFKLACSENGCVSPTMRRIEDDGRQGQKYDLVDSCEHNVYSKPILLTNLMSQFQRFLSKYFFLFFVFNFMEWILLFQYDNATKDRLNRRRRMNFLHKLTINCNPRF